MSSGVAPTTTTSHASTPVAVGSTTSRAVPSAVPPDASAARLVACSGLIVGVVSTASSGKTRPRMPVTRCSSVLAGLPRPVKTREASRTGTAPSAWVARVVVTFGTVSVSGSPSRRVAESTPNRAGPCSSMNAAGLPGQRAAGQLGEESGDVVLAAGPAGAGVRAQPLDGVAQRLDAGRGLAPGLVVADPGLGDHRA